MCEHTHTRFTNKHAYTPRNTQIQPQSIGALKNDEIKTHTITDTAVTSKRYRGTRHMLPLSQPLTKYSQHNTSTTQTNKPRARLEPTTIPQPNKTPTFNPPTNNNNNTQLRNIYHNTQPFNKRQLTFQTKSPQPTKLRKPNKTTIQTHNYTTFKPPTKHHNIFNTTSIPTQHELTTDIFPTSIPVKEDAGKYGLMWPRGAIANAHPAANLLKFYSSKGCPVDTGEDWTVEMITTAIKRGPHISARMQEAKQYLQAETTEKVNGNYVKIVKWKDIKSNPPPKLKISPIALIPHKSRSFRCILDLSFNLKIKGKTIPSVNDGTSILSPQKAMAQLGWVTRRIIKTMADHYNPEKPFLFSKCDIKDGFWRMSVSQEDAWNFCYTLPKQHIPYINPSQGRCR